MPTHFTPEALKFLRNLARHNDREWFLPRKPIYERELRTPMLALIEEINHAFATFAPGHIRPPQKAMLRIYRDTRFAADKRPYKNHVAAWWSHSGPHTKVARTSGAGYYVSISPARLLIAAGAYMPTPEQLLAIRRHMLDHHAEFRALIANKKLRAAFGEMEGNRLTRPPRGFAASDPAALAAQDLILCRQWGFSATLPAEIATGNTLLKEVARRFALVAPIVDFLNAPILKNISHTPKIPHF